MRTAVSDIEPYLSKDGSIIQELMHPRVHENAKQSLARAVIEANVTTALHKHLNTEELYHITSGTGRMVLGDETLTVQTGDTILISPGTAHQLINTGTEPLILLCACAPPYSDSDTVLL